MNGTPWLHYQTPTPTGGVLVGEVDVDGVGGGHDAAELLLLLLLLLLL